jgi:hypothetical protein
MHCARDRRLVYNKASLERKFTHRHACAVVEVEVAIVLQLPADGGEQVINFLACSLFGFYRTGMPAIPRRLL